MKNSRNITPPQLVHMVHCNFFFLNQENLISNKSFFLCHVSLHVHSTHRRSSRSLPLRLWFNSRLCQGKEWIRNEFQKLLLILILDLYPSQGWCQYCRAGAPAGKKNLSSLMDGEHKVTTDVYYYYLRFLLYFLLKPYFKDSFSDSLQSYLLYFQILDFQKGKDWT